MDAYPVTWSLVTWSPAHPVTDHLVTRVARSLMRPQPTPELVPRLRGSSYSGHDYAPGDRRWTWQEWQVEAAELLLGTLFDRGAPGRFLHPAG